MPSGKRQAAGILVAQSLTLAKARHIPGRYSALLISFATSLFLWTVSSRNRPSLQDDARRVPQQKDTTSVG